MAAAAVPRGDFGLIPNPALYIPLEFKDDKGVIHTGNSWANLILKVGQYRSRNGLPQGDPEKEVLTQACERYPDRCLDTKNRKLPALADDLNLRVLSWIVATFERYKNSAVFATETEARQRAAVCAACPRQHNWRNKCGSCAARADDLKRKLLAEKHTTFSDKLEGCLALGEDCRTSVWIAQPGIEGDRLPANCWRKA